METFSGLVRNECKWIFIFSDNVRILFLSCNFIFSDNVRILFLSCNFIFSDNVILQFYGFRQCTYIVFILQFYIFRQCTYICFYPAILMYVYCFYPAILYFQTTYVYCFYPAMWKSPTKLTNILKRNRNNRRSNRFQWCPLPRPCLYSAVSNHHYTWIKYQKSNILVSDRI